MSFNYIWLNIGKIQMFIYLIILIIKTKKYTQLGKDCNAFFLPPCSLMNSNHMSRGGCTSNYKVAEIKQYNLSPTGCTPLRLQYALLKTVISGLSIWSKIGHSSRSSSIQRSKITADQRCMDKRQTDKKKKRLKGKYTKKE